MIAAMGKTFAEIRMEVEQAMNRGDLTEEQMQDIMRNARDERKPIWIQTANDPPKRWTHKDYGASVTIGEDEINSCLSIGSGISNVKIQDGSVDMEVPTVDTETDKPLVAAMYCIDCFSMTGEKKYASMVGWGFSFCDEHAQKFIDNQKRIHHDKWMEANER